MTWERRYEDGKGLYLRKSLPYAPIRGGEHPYYEENRQAEVPGHYNKNPRVRERRGGVRMESFISQRRPQMGRRWRESISPRWRWGAERKKYTSSVKKKRGTKRGTISQRKLAGPPHLLGKSTIVQSAESQKIRAGNLARIDRRENEQNNSI